MKNFEIKIRSSKNFDDFQKILIFSADKTKLSEYELEGAQ